MRRAVPLLFTACLPNIGVGVDAGPTVDPGWVLSQPFPEVESLNDVVTLEEGRAWAVGTGGTIVKAVDSVWTKEESPTTEDLDSVSAHWDPDNEIEAVIAVGASGTIVELVDGEWRALPVDLDAHLFGVWMHDPALAYAVGEGGVIVQIAEHVAREMVDESLQWRTNPDGSTESYPIPEPLKAVGGYGPSDVVAVGARGAVYHFDGTTWSREDANTSRPLTDLYAGAGIWSTSTDGIVLYRNGFSDWDVDNWRAPAPVFLQGVWTDWSLLVAVGFAGSLFVRESGEWTSVPLADELVLRAVSGVVVKPAEGESVAVYDVYAVGGGGRIVRGPTAYPADAGPQ